MSRETRLERAIRGVLETAIDRGEWNGNIYWNVPSVRDGLIYRGQTSARTLLRDAGYVWNGNVIVATRRVVKRLRRMGSA